MAPAISSTLVQPPSTPLCTTMRTMITRHRYNARLLQFAQGSHCGQIVASASWVFVQSRIGQSHNRAMDKLESRLRLHGDNVLNTTLADLKQITARGTGDFFNRTCISTDCLPTSVSLNIASLDTDVPSNIRLIAEVVCSTYK